MVTANLGSEETRQEPGAARQRWMGLLARACPERLAALSDPVAGAAGYELVRGPETGLVMVRGRIGGSGAPFNLGEMPVTRCTVRIESGEVGHAYVQGRDGTHAERAALLDALLQTEQRREAVMSGVIDVLGDAEKTGRERKAAKAAATRVNFFTMTRGED